MREPGDSTDGKLAFSALCLYALPAAGTGYMFLLFTLYLMKFATDVLLIAPGVMGVILGLSRVWDAVSDPLAGYLSDRTKARAGRRRPWMFVAAPLIGLSFIMAFSPPAAMSGDAATWWMTVAIFGFFTAMTVFIVPHLSLGAELSHLSHDRSRIFGARHAAWNLGSIAALGAMAVLISAELDGPAAIRATASQVALISSAAVAVLIILATMRLRERPEFQGRGGTHPVRAFRDVWQNRHARLLLIVNFVDHLGLAIISILTLYVAEYVIGAPELAPLFILSFMIPAVITVPLWVALAGRFGKKPVWLGSMVLASCSFGGMFFVSEGAIAQIMILAALAGASHGNTGAIGPSLQGDVIDYDEHLTGERKEGAYFAAWTFSTKFAFGLTFLITGLALEWAGFVPNVEQTETVKLTLRSLYGLYPLVWYGIGALLFTRFTLIGNEYATMKTALELQRAQT